MHAVSMAAAAEAACYTRGAVASLNWVKKNMHVAML